MPTFLATAKMDPALAARVEASVLGRDGARRSAARTRRFVALARIALVATVAFGIYNVVATRRENRRALERQRAALLESARTESATLTPEAREAMARIETWLLRLSGGYEGDHLDPALREPGALATALARPLVYVRGPAEALGSAASIPAAAAASTKDALVLCLLEPPEQRTEKALLDKVRVAYAGGWNLESRTPHVRPLSDLVVGLPYLLPPWSDRVRAVEDATELASLRAGFERAPLGHAKEAARAGLLLVAIDEHAAGDGPTELDGERAHPVRVALVDVAASRVVLRARRVVDPSWISPARRPTYASGLDSCALALDVLEAAR